MRCVMKKGSVLIVHKSKDKNSGAPSVSDGESDLPLTNKSYVAPVAAGQN